MEIDPALLGDDSARPVSEGPSERPVQDVPPAPVLVGHDNPELDVKKFTIKAAYKLLEQKQRDRQEILQGLMDFCKDISRSGDGNQLALEFMSVVVNACKDHPLTPGRQLGELRQEMGLVLTRASQLVGEQGERGQEGDTTGRQEPGRQGAGLTIAELTEGLDMDDMDDFVP